MSDTPKMVAIVGRPNVGKSALFNRLAGKSIAIVHDRPGVTRDRLVSVCTRAAEPFEIMDTGGIGENTQDDFNRQVQAEAKIALDVADLILFIVDGFNGITPVDMDLARTLRRTTKPLILVVNKMDSEKRLQHGAEFARLGFKEVIHTSATHGLGMKELLEAVCKHLEIPLKGPSKSKAKGKDSRSKKEKQPEQETDQEEVVEVEVLDQDQDLANDPDLLEDHDTAPGLEEEDAAPAKPNKPRRPLRLAIVGRPNAGKSSLVNALLGKQRTIVSDIAGTTRDSIDIPFEHGGQSYVLIDTAGLRRKAKIHDEVETFSAMQATRSIRRADLCLLMLDATGITMQDRKVAQLIVEQQKPCIILLNKFDLYHPTARLKARKEELLETASRELFFLTYAPMLPISAREGQHLDQIFKTVERVYAGAQQPPSTGALNRLLHAVMDRSSAALGRSGKAFHLLYATLLKEDEPRAIPTPHIVLFANRADQLQDSFLRHLESVVREEWAAEGLPFRWSIRGKKKRPQDEAS